MIKARVATDSVHMWTDIDRETGRQTFGDFPAVRSLPKDGLGVEVDITGRWSIVPVQVAELYKEFPVRDWKER